MKKKKQRARNDEGQYKGDNPATQVNEAWEPTPVVVPKYLSLPEEVSRTMDQRLRKWIKRFSG